ncbi:ferredoxin [Mycolicibacterium sp. CBMA 226]|uniref:ferredoxin n=1 Tax=Mycolicibacterium sp. CBMA 226 TaxID=2606611 RepID=UPI0012DFE564|nr:ferredoxin [Mycolicibacterium sp. CBMA 226]MUL75805.1 ferredoxin [Mycolicibacterium sp. CBMA 226]
MKIRLDRTMCDGFGMCAKHAPSYFSLDDWGYASLVGTGEVPEADQPAVLRALLDCPVHAIIDVAGGPIVVPTSAPIPDEAPEPHPETDANEAEWGFVR